MLLELEFMALLLLLLLLAEDLGLTMKSLAFALAEAEEADEAVAGAVEVALTVEEVGLSSTTCFLPPVPIIGKKKLESRRMQDQRSTSY